MREVLLGFLSIAFIYAGSVWLTDQISKDMEYNIDEAIHAAVAQRIRLEIEKAIVNQLGGEPVQK